jgi:hypothetical protein
VAVGVVDSLWPGMDGGSSTGIGTSPTVLMRCWNHDPSPRVCRCSSPCVDVAYFAQVVVDEELGTVVWPNGADLAPEMLHERAMSLA